MANNLAAFQRETWSKRLVERVDQINVMLPLVNRNWEGDLTQSKSVWIRTVGDITMAPYTRGTNITYEDLAPTKEQFIVNDGQYFAFNIDDIDKAQNDLSAMDLYMQRAVITMNNKIEEKLVNGFVQYCPPGNYLQNSANTGAGAVATATVANGTISAITISSGGAGYVQGKVGVILMGVGTGTTGTVTVTAGTVASVAIVSGGAGWKSPPLVTFTAAAPITLDSSTSATTGIYGQFLAARAKLHNANVYGQQWALVSPDVSTLLLNDTDHFIKGSQLGDNVLQYALVDQTVRGTPANRAPGFLGMIAGFLVYETPHVPRDLTGGTYIIWGDNDVLSYAAQITEIEVLRLQNTFADACRGLMLHDTYAPTESRKRLVMLRSAAA